MDNGALFDLNGNGMTMQVYPNRVVIDAKKGFQGAITGRSVFGTKEIYYESMTSVQYCKPGLIRNGYIHFEYPGAAHCDNIFLSENTFIVAKMISDLKLCEQAYQYIQERVLFYKRQKEAERAPASAADELRKFKTLLDEGAITQAEYEAKKKQLLGL